MRSFFALALAGVVASKTITAQDFEFMKYITSFNKRYETREEFDMRKELFKQAAVEIVEHNMGNNTSTMGHNQFSDWTDEEYNGMMGFLALEPLGEGGMNLTFEPTTETEVDWVAKGAVTAVKNQGACGSCWSFSATGSMEGAHFLATGELLSLSEQELVSCSHNGNLGCMGGMMDKAFSWTETTKLETESDYPYKGWLGALSCNSDKTKGKVGVTSYMDVTPSSSEALKAAIAKGPVSVAI